ncbi:ABC transporter permease [Leucobacter allii]|uniref:ABC transporter permease n=1 Tax=Leucobacter allii TaxID=2932247 RepID=UPI001FD2BE01|nr:ABC transporter permease [Leucobacter allii]UOR01539.1 ABC transporter permease [Leucobacter allii]
MAQSVLVVWAAWTLSFIVLFLLPGDPALNLVAGGDAGQIVDPDELARVRAQYGLDQPVIVQYGTRLLAALTGDFGSSMVTGRPVADIIGEGLPGTLAVIGGALLIGCLLGTGVALLATYTRVGWLRGALLSLPPLGISLPTFWVGLMLIQLLSFQLRALPPTGNAGIPSLIMPWLTLALPTAATVGQVLAKSLATVQAEPYVTTARAIGVRRAVIHLRDVLRNASIPAVTVAGVVVSSLLGGAIVIENVYSRAGIGRATVQAVLQRDIAVVQGIVVLGAVIFVLVSLVVDLAYPLIDARLRSTLNGGSR